MSSNDSELRLSFWRDGPTKSERLAAAVINLFGFEEIDPQSPLGGPDGRKDIVCLKGRYKWICGVYFPNSPKSFTTTKKKFLHDLEGVGTDINGFIFFTNQNLTPKQRKILEDIAGKEQKFCEIIHLQKIISALDSPKGYGIRVQYLRIPMTVDEQISWFEEAGRGTEIALKEQTRLIQALSISISKLQSGQSHIISTMGIPKAFESVSPDLISTTQYEKSDNLLDLSKHLTPEFILFVHRVICVELPNSVLGKFRTTDVRLGNNHGQQANHVSLTSPEKIVEELTFLCDDWSRNFNRRNADGVKFKSVAQFHTKFLQIHPFLDGNGRVAKAILMQQVLDYFGKADMSLFSKGTDYFDALKKADENKFDDLILLIEKVVS